MQARAYVTSHGELELCLLLLLLCGDDVAEVQEAAYMALESGAGAWLSPALHALPHTAEAMVGVAPKDVFAFSHAPAAEDKAMIEDAEAQLQGSSVSAAEGKGSTGGDGEARQGYLASCRFVACHINGLIEPLCRGITDWTAESRLRYLHGLHNTFLLAGSQACLLIAELCLQALGAPCRDDDPAVRQAAEVLLGTGGGGLQ